MSKCDKTWCFPKTCRKPLYLWSLCL